jgi:hypothetical protein
MDPAVIKEAAADCLKRCFGVLADALAIAPVGGTEEEAERRFRSCCGACERARKVAERLKGAKP